MLAVVEMNLEEYPAFRLGRRSKRPELRYSRTRTQEDGRAMEQLWIVRGAGDLGLPGPFEQDLYVALLVLFTEQGLPGDGRIRFTRNRIAQIMDVSNSGRGYELIEQGLSRLAAATVHTEHAFYRPAPAGADGKRSAPTERLSLDFHILEEVRVYERNAPSFLEDAAEADGVGSATKRPRVEHARPFELSVARLGLPLVQSYERRYTKPLDATFYFALERPLSKRLYRYVDKVRNGRGSFEIGIRALADVLGLEYRYPSDIKDGLAEAHAELHAQGFLAAAEYAPLAGGPTAGEKVVYAFDSSFDQRPRLRAGAVPTALPAGAERGRRGDAETAAAQPETAKSDATLGSLDSTRSDIGRSALGAPVSPLQEALVQIGMSPTRAADLVSRFPEAHIQARLDHVRALMRDKHARPIRNPAGYLAKAIEDSYAVPTRAEPTPLRDVVRAAAPLHPTPAGETPALPGQQAPLEDATSSALSTQHSALQPDLHPLFAALRTSLTAATYAAWVLPARVDTVEDAVDRKSAVKVLLPSQFTLDRWHRPPVAPALAAAAAALGLHVTLEVASSHAEDSHEATTQARED